MSNKLNKNPDTAAGNVDTDNLTVAHAVLTQGGTAEASKAASGPEFTIERLRRDCLALFGVTTSTFDGATRGLDGKYTVEEMKSCIDKWKNTPLAPAGKKEGKL